MYFSEAWAKVFNSKVTDLSNAFSCTLALDGYVSVWQVCGSFDMA